MTDLLSPPTVLHHHVLYYTPFLSLSLSLSLHPQETHINLDITDSWVLRLPLFRWETGKQTQMRQWQREQEEERDYCNVRSALQVSDATKLDYNQWNCPSVRWCISFSTGSCRQGYKVLINVMCFFITMCKFFYWENIILSALFSQKGISRNKK